MPDNIIVRILNKIFDLILLNVLWVVSSIPVITVGAATTALYTVTLRMIRGEEGYIAKDFWNAFKANFKQGTIIWSLLVLFGSIAYFDGRIWLEKGNVPSVVLWPLMCFVGIVLGIETIFVFPFLSQFHNTIKNTMKNAILIPIGKLPLTAVLLVMNLVCILFTFMNRATMLLGIGIWLVIGVALIAYVNSIMIEKIIKPYRP